MTWIGAVSVVVTVLAAIACTQMSQSATTVLPVPLQPLAQQAHQIENALAYLGQPLSVEEISTIDEAATEPSESKAVDQLLRILDAHVLAVVEINAESRVK